METLVPDTSVLIDGRITKLLAAKEYPGAKVLVPLAALAELEAQANRGLETGVAGLDELAELQDMARRKEVVVAFVGERPSPEEVARADLGAIDARIRDVAAAEDALFVTSDRIQAHAAAAQGIRHHYLRPQVEETPDLTGLALWAFFDATTMSVHLKADCIPMVKRGRPGEVNYEAAGKKAMAHGELRRIIRECIEFTKQDYNSFIEIERHGCTVLQLGPMRITIAQPPFSDALELTAVRPITKTSLADYELDEEIVERLEGHSRGVFVSGRPGSGKSTFVAAVAEHLHGLGRVVKTMESPRDLQVPKEVTQYAPLDRDMKWTGDVVLLVRPDHVLYDEVRTTEDFLTFADMRLAGVGLIGVTHANRAIDAVQRLIGRVELGMIPQVVDTILFIEDGALGAVLELDYTVKVPVGMTDADLARPVVVVRDVLQGEPVYELYTYGDQVVVMPVEGREESSAASGLAARELERTLRRRVQGPMEVEVHGNRAIVRVPEAEVPQLIGRGGRTVQGLERRLGIRLDIQPLRGRPERGPRRREDTGASVRRTGNNVFVSVDGPGVYRVDVEGAEIGESTASQKGKLRFKASSPEGQALLEAQKRGFAVTVERID